MIERMDDPDQDQEPTCVCGSTNIENVGPPGGSPVRFCRYCGSTWRDEVDCTHQTTEKPIRWWHLKTRITRWAREQTIDRVVSSLARQMQLRRWD